MPTIKGLDKTGLETVLDQCAPVKGSVFIHGGGENAAQYFTIKGPVQ